MNIYMPNGTLADHLHKLGTHLSWVQRLKICIGAARGLDYLHTGTGIDVGVTHRDVKSSNILLDESWAARISDFGLSKIGPTNQPSTYVNTLVKGTFGYLDPDYSFTGRLTRKSDVYALGVVLLEVLCRKPALDRSLDEDQQNLATWATESIREGNLKHIIDSGIKGEILPKCLKKFVRVAERCLHNNPKQRPTMAEVVVTLESVLTLQEKYNMSLQDASKTIFGKMLDLFIFPSNGDNPEKCLHDNVKQHPDMAEVAVNLDTVLTLQTKINSSLQPVGVLLEIDKHVTETVESRDSVSPRGEDDIGIKSRIPVSTPMTNEVKDEWIEQYQPGVYITLVDFHDGTRELKRARFSRRTFREQEAETWWSENREQVYERYNVLRSNMPRVSSAHTTLGTRVQMGMKNHVSVADESKDSVSPREEISDEWIEQYEPGVYIYLVALHDGTRDMKKVRFSRRRFGEQEAETWWSENREQVYERYNVLPSNKPWLGFFSKYSI